MKKFIALATVTLVASISFTSINPVAASADDKFFNDTISSSTSLASQHMITVVDPIGQYKLSSTMSQPTIGEMLKADGMGIGSYRTGENAQLDPDTVVPVGLKTKIYRVSSASATQIVDIPFQTITAKTDELLEGTTEVRTKGVVGKALKTVVDEAVVTDANKTVSQESFIVLEAPQPETIIVGTRVIKEVVNQEVDFVVGQGVGGGDNPDWAKNDRATIEETFNNTSNKELVSLMLEHVGKPYIWATQGPNTFDCSGLVYYVMNKYGNKMPRLTAVEYGKSSTPVLKSELVPGDIVWTPKHIGLYAGDGKVVHAANSRVGVVVTDLSWFEARNYSYGRLG